MSEVRVEPLGDQQQATDPVAIRSGVGVRRALKWYFTFYNDERPHKALNYRRRRNSQREGRDIYEVEIQSSRLPTTTNLRRPSTGSRFSLGNNALRMIFSRANLVQRAADFAPVARDEPPTLFKTTCCGVQIHSPTFVAIDGCRRTRRLPGHAPPLTDSVRWSGSLQSEVPPCFSNADAHISSIPKPSHREKLLTARALRNLGSRCFRKDAAVGQDGHACMASAATSRNSFSVVPLAD
jgi:hypothetical protein